MRRAPLGFALLVLVHCGSPTGPGGPPPLLTELPRALSPAEVRIADAANAFAFDLLREATRALPPDSNVFLSPLSASMALGMALNGAGGETFEAMRATLGLAEMSEAEINQSYRDLIALLGDLDAGTEMRVANSMWAREGQVLLPGFTAAGRDFFDAEVATLDFGDPAAVETINQWVEAKTNGKIPRLLDGIAREEVLFLINAIYFKGRWRNGAFAMTVLLPRPGSTPSEVLAALDPASWRELMDRFHETTVSLTLPRFRLEYRRRMQDDLAALGMGIAFEDGRADFSRIAGQGSGLYITRVDQKTFVEVNEEGTEAAAATSVGFGVTSAPQVQEMKVDRPFVLAIRERFSGTILFLGLMSLIGE